MVNVRFCHDRFNCTQLGTYRCPVRLWILRSKFEKEKVVTGDVLFFISFEILGMFSYLCSLLCIISAFVLVCFSSLFSSYRLIRQSSLHLALLFCKAENLPDNAYNVKKQNKRKQTRCLISFHWRKVHGDVHHRAIYWNVI